MSDTVSSGTAAPPSSEDRGLAFLGYGLLLVSPFLAGMSGLVGVVLAYVRRGGAAPLERSHYNFQIRIFWITVAIFALAVIAFAVGAGYLITDIVNAATNNGEQWDAWEVAAFEDRNIRFHGESIVGFLISLALGGISALWLFVSSLVGLFLLADQRPVGRS